MRTNVLTILAGLVFTILSVGSSFAGPPMTGSASGKGGSNWGDKLNPTQWSWPTMPTMPWSAEPARIKKKSPSIMTNMNKTAKNSWQKTKRALDPSRLLDSDSKPKPQQKSSGDGFFGGLFKPVEDPKEIKTVNDFLSQPQPR